MAKKSPKSVDLLINQGINDPTWRALLAAAPDKEKFLLNALEELLENHSSLQSRYDSAMDEMYFNYD